jgi:GNAT superfamily N-acetyltransferase
MDIKPLDWAKHRHDVARFFSSAADYVMLEHGQAPDARMVDAFFDERPPSVAPENTLQFGMFEAEHLIGVAGMLYGFPEKTDAYIGLMLLSPGARGHGNGPRILGHMTSLARARGMRRQLVAVLDANPKGRAFWEREGFALSQTFAPTDDEHTRHRLIRAI